MLFRRDLRDGVSLDGRRSRTTERAMRGVVVGDMAYFVLCKDAVPDPLTMLLLS